MDNKQVSGNQQPSAHDQGRKKNFSNKRNGSKKNAFVGKKNNSAKEKNSLQRSFDELERNLEAKLESSLGLNQSDNNRNKSAKKGQNQKKNGNKSARSGQKKTDSAPKKRAENKKQSPPKNKSANGKGAKTSGGLFSFSKLKLDRKNKGKNNTKGTEKLSIIPLGGLGEIGKNMTAIKYGNDILVVDGGMSFPDDDLPGIDLVIPDYSYLLENRSMVRAVVVTHGHEDHIGGLPYLLRDLPMPVYSGKLTLGLIRSKLEEHNIQGIALNEVHNRNVIKIGPFRVEFIRVSHSIPDSFALAIHTPVGIIVHTGDFKLDMSPVDNQFMDLARFSELGEQGVLLMMADSTNVERPGFTPSERSVGATLETTFLGATGRIIVTSFASNVHRIQQVIWTAEATNRKVAVVGRGMTNVMGIAMEMGYLQVKPDTLVDISEINSYPDKKVTILTTGSQGESFAGLTRMSQGEHRQIKIREGDLIVISANAIPGNEKTVAKTIDNLYRRGAEVMYGRSLGIHVSGHASAEDLKLMFNMVKPRFFMPVHGEYRMLCAHGKLAEKMGVPAEDVFLLENGQVLELNGTSGKISGKVQSGRILIDGLGVGDVGTAVLKERRQLSSDGIVIANVVMDKRNGRSVADPYLVSRGFVYERDNDLIISEAEQIVQNICDDYLGKDYHLPAMKSHIRSALSKYLYEQTGRKPIILPIVMEV